MDHARAGPPLKEGLPAALARVYGGILRCQGRTTTAFVRWSQVTKCAHGFARLGGVETREVLLHGQGPLRIRRNSPMVKSSLPDVRPDECVFDL